jgi:hypothetical protein
MDGVFVDTEPRPLRCNCGSTAVVESPSEGWALVRFDNTGETKGILPVRIAICQDCGMVILFAPWLPHPAR